MQDIIKKIKFKDTGIVINAPIIKEKEFIILGFKTKFDKTKSTNTLAFSNGNKEF